MEKSEILQFFSNIDKTREEVIKIILEDINDRTIESFNEFYPIDEDNFDYITAFDLLSIIYEAPENYEDKKRYSIINKFNSIAEEIIDNLSLLTMVILEDNFESSDFSNSKHILKKDLRKRTKCNFESDKIQNYIKKYGYPLINELF